MLEKLIKGIIAGMICVFLGGCGNMKDPIVEGGTTDKTDHKAPKVIKSKEITGFSTSFYISGEWSDGNPDITYFFNIKKDDNGKLVASETHTKVSFEADTELLTELQKVVDEYKLSEFNGINKVTAGLPYEYESHTTNILYSSGESIHFTMNNDPDAKWTRAVYLVFAEWFNSKGITTLMPPKEDAAVTRIDIDIRMDGIYTEYSGIIVGDEDAIDGENYLLQKSVYDTVKKEEVMWKFVKFPDDYYDRIFEILNTFDIRPFDPYSALYGEGRENKNDDDYNKSKICIYIVTADDKHRHIGVSSDSDLAMLMPFIGKLKAYHETLFGRPLDEIEKIELGETYEDVSVKIGVSDGAYGSGFIGDLYYLDDGNKAVIYYSDEKGAVKNGGIGGTVSRIILVYPDGTSKIIKDRG